MGCRFVWRKKIERDVSQGVPLDEFSIKAERKRQRERLVCESKLMRRHCLLFAKLKPLLSLCHLNFGFSWSFL